MEVKSNIGIQVELNTDYEKALELVTEALKTEGFGVLTEIDVKATLKKKINVDFRPYKILGACNPPLAYRALTAAPSVGLLLPCNVTVSQEEDHILISIIDPIAMLDVVQHPDLAEIASEAQEKLYRVTEKLKVV